jgi:hypothetical protein
MNREDLIDKVLDQMLTDIEGGDLTAIEELLKNVSDETLIAYLPEEVGHEFR